MTWRTTERLAVRVGKIRWVYGRLWKVCVELWCVATHTLSHIMKHGEKPLCWAAEDGDD